MNTRACITSLQPPPAQTTEGDRNLHARDLCLVAPAPQSRLG